MAVQYLFNRAWNVTIGFPGGVGKSYDSLHVTFDLHKESFGGCTNKSKVEVYNLSQDSRKFFQQKGLQITLKAGYQNLLKTIMIADVTRMVTKRKGPDIVTEFECGEGEKVLSTMYFKKSYPPGTPYYQIIQDILVQMQDNGIGIGVVANLPNTRFNQGRTFATSAKTILDFLLKKANLEWSIFNNQIQILPRNAHSEQATIVLSKASGLIGVPTQKDDGIEFLSLLNPDLTPGAPVQLICGEVAGQLDVYNLNQSSISGFYRIRNAHYEGDSHGEKWWVRCEANRIVPVQNLKLNQGKNLQPAVTNG